MTIASLPRSISGATMLGSTTMLGGGSAWTLTLWVSCSNLDQFWPPPDGCDDGHLLRYGPDEQDEGWEKTVTKYIFKLSGKSIEQPFLEGGRGGLIVNTASAAGLVFNQVGQLEPHVTTQSLQPGCWSLTSQVPLWCVVGEPSQVPRPSELGNLTCQRLQKWWFVL